MAYVNPDNTLTPPGYSEPNEPLYPRRPKVYPNSDKILALEEPNVRIALYGCKDPDLLAKFAQSFPECFTDDPTSKTVYPLQVLIHAKKALETTEGISHPLDFCAAWFSQKGLSTLACWWIDDEPDGIENHEVESLRQQIIGKVATPFMQVTHRGIDCVITSFSENEEEGKDLITLGEIIPDNVTISYIHLAPVGHILYETS